MKRICIPVLTFIVGLGAGVLAGWLIWGDVRITTGVLCLDGSAPDANGCCGAEVYTDMGAAGFNCCPPDGVSDCFPPIK